MTKKEVKNSILCSRLNLPSNVVANRLKRQNPSIDTLGEMLRAMDYKIIIVPTETKLKQGQYDIEV